MSERSNPCIVCAANRMPDGTMFIGARHWDELMCAQADRYVKLNGLEDHEVGEAEQGFMDQWGHFLTRRAAWFIAEQNGQILHRGPGYNGPDLFSENLY